MYKGVQGDGLQPAGACVGWGLGGMCGEAARVGGPGRASWETACPMCCGGPETVLRWGLRQASGGTSSWSHNVERVLDHM